MSTEPSINSSAENIAVAIELLEELYSMLSYSCGHYLFNSDNPFRSVSIPQPEFLRKMLHLSAQLGRTPAFIKKAISLAIDHELDRETLHTELLHVVLEFLTTPDLKEIAIKQCDSLRDDGLPNKTEKSSYSWTNRRENLALFGLFVYISLCEHDAGIKYFQQHYPTQKDKEIKLYVLLRWLFTYQLKECWLSEYKQALKEKMGLLQIVWVN